MTTVLQKLLQDLETRGPGVLPPLVDEVEKVSGVRLPSDYRDLVYAMNGAVGLVEGQVFVEFWSVEDLIPQLKETAMREYAPGYLAIGSDGGGEWIAVRDLNGKSEIGYLQMIGDAKDFRVIADSIESFLLKNLTRKRSGRSLLSDS